MDSTTNEGNQPSSTATYVLAAICLVAGIAVGYLMHSPAAHTAPAPGVARPAGMDAATGMPTPDQMKHMIEKAAEPTLLALQKDPDNPDLMAQLAAVYYRAQDFPTAADYLERALKIKPTAGGFVVLSNAYHNGGADDRAIEALNSALKMDPKSANALFNRGMLNWKVKGDPKAAIEDWQQLLKTNPKHPHRAEVEAMIAKAKKHEGMAPDAKTTKPGM